MWFLLGGGKNNSLVDVSCEFAQGPSAQCTNLWIIIAVTDNFVLRVFISITEMQARDELEGEDERVRERKLRASESQ